MAIVFDEVTARIDDDPGDEPADPGERDELVEEQEPNPGALCRQLARLEYRKARLRAD